MTEMLTNLVQLQEVFEEKLDLEKQIKQLNRAIIEQNQKMEKVGKQFEQVNQQMEQLARQIQDYQGQLQIKIQKKQEQEQLITQITTQREYEAIEKAMKEITLDEMEIRKELQRAKQKKEILAEQQEQVQQEYEQIIQQQKDDAGKREKQVADKTKQCQKVEQRCQEISASFDENVLFKFERILRHKHLAIVPLENGVCTGCHMLLPPYFINKVKANKELEFCPYCSRTLYCQEFEQQEWNQQSSGLSDLFEDQAD